MFLVVWSDIVLSPASVGPDHTLLQAKSGVRIVSSEIDKTILHITEREVVWNVPAKSVNLDTKYVVSHRVSYSSIHLPIRPLSPGAG